jgi:ribosome biogenesis GTPase
VGLQPGRVVTRFGAEVVIEDERGQQHRCTARRRHQDIVCGDRVRWLPGDEQGMGIVEELLPRANALTRQVSHGPPRAIAANIDQFLVVCSPAPLPDWTMVDRYLVSARMLEAHAVIVVNKGDHPEALEVLHDAEARYGKPGYPAVLTSALKPLSIEGLTPYLKGHTSILVGQSGVGKSSLINALLPDVDARVAEADTHPGKHTTTRATLYHLPGGGELIDSPGVRDFQPVIPDWQTLEHGFVEFEAFRQQCRFHNCRHQAEPGCAVKQAVEDGAISRARYESYLATLQQIGSNPY